MFCQSVVITLSSLVSIPLGDELQVVFLSENNNTVNGASNHTVTNGINGTQEEENNINRIANCTHNSQYWRV